MQDENFKFVIVGGGTAGWLTALTIRKMFPSSQVTVVASKEIGILGAGEGGAPPFKFLMEALDISINELVKHTKSTIKNGIKFTNWNGDGTSYYHGFLDDPEVDANVQGKTLQQDISLLYLKQFADGLDLDEVNFNTVISEKGLIKYYDTPLRRIGLDAIHFDASLLAKYFQTLGFERRIKLVDDRILDFKTDDQDYITEVVLENGSETCDFIFDCSGFARLIIGKFYKSEWNSYKNKLPVKRAMPFFIQHNLEDIPPYTEAVALKYGWMWKIPLQGRFGCGYAFDSNYITDEQAKQEVEEYLGHTVTVPKMFSFEAGYYNKTCIKNCIAIGLSSGFIEPTEATSITAAIQSIKYFADNHRHILNKDQLSIDQYNTVVNKLNEHILNFIYVHYVSKRADTDFWKNFTTNNEMPDQAREIIEALKTNILDEKFFEQLFKKYPAPIFPSTAWYMVLAGVRAFDPTLAKEKLSIIDPDNTSLELKNKFIKNINDLLPNVISHKAMIKGIL